MKIAITGGTGFIGQRLIARHLCLGDEVVYLTRRQPKSETAAQPFIGDLTSSAKELKNFTQNADVLYHCAAEIRDVEKINSTNVEGTKNLIDAAKGNINRWVQLSSIGVYGRNVKGIVEENSPLLPTNLYEVSKARSDGLVLQAAKRYDFDTFILRPSNVYGNDMQNQSIFRLIEVVDKERFFFIGKKRAIVNYIHVENVVDALVLCATTTQKMGTFIVSDTCDLKIFIELIALALEKKVPQISIPEPLVRLFAICTSKLMPSLLTTSKVDALTSTVTHEIFKIQKELNFRNNISMQKGITELVHHWKSLQV